MVHKISVCTSSCPYCNTTISKEYNGSSAWGPKFGRCPKCHKIFKTNKKLYSDTSKAERDSDRKEFLQVIPILIPLFIVSLLITIFTGWALMGLIAFASGMSVFVITISYNSRNKMVLSKYIDLKESDPELYQLEYDETIRLIGNQSINNIEYELFNAIETKIIRFLGCFALSFLGSEMLLMILLGDSIDGASALIILLVVTLIISSIIYYLLTQSKKSAISNRDFKPNKRFVYKTPQNPNYTSNNRTIINNTISMNTDSINNDNVQKEPPSHICFSSPNETHSNTTGRFYGEDILLQTPNSPPPTENKSFSVDIIANGLAELCIKELVDIMGICHKHQVSYNDKKLIISTFSYYYTIWIYNFDNITVGQAEEVEKIYTNHFRNFNRKNFENSPFREVLENEDMFLEQLKRVDRRIRNSYQSNGHIFVDDGISDEFILEFIDNINDKDKINSEIVYKILKEWAYVAGEAGKQSTIIQ